MLGTADAAERAHKAHGLLLLAQDLTRRLEVDYWEAVKEAAEAGSPIHKILLQQRYDENMIERGKRTGFIVEPLEETDGSTRHE